MGTPRDRPLPNYWKSCSDMETKHHSHTRASITILCVLSLTLLHAASEVAADPVPEELLGDWSLDLESGGPAWMSVGEKEVRLRVYVGPEGPYPIEKIEDGRVHFVRKTRRKVDGKRVPVSSAVRVGITGGKLDGMITRGQQGDGKEETIRFTGKRIPPIPKSPPNLSKVRFGHPILLFNGKDLTGWRAHEKDKKMGWSAKGGLLVNETPKTDFSATGDHANLRTEAEFEDFWLHIEFLVEAQRNSGVYLRGMYEAQVVDRDSRMQGIPGCRCHLRPDRSKRERRQPAGRMEHLRPHPGGSPRHRRPQRREGHRQPAGHRPDRRRDLHRPYFTRADLPAGRPHLGEIQEHLPGTGYGSAMKNWCWAKPVDPAVPGGRLHAPRTLPRRSPIPQRSGALPGSEPT